MSPHHPDNYENDLYCFYYIHNPFNHLLTITFQTFAVEYHIDCGFDYLRVGILLHSCLDRCLFTYLGIHVLRAFIPFCMWPPRINEIKCSKF